MTEAKADELWCYSVSGDAECLDGECDCREEAIDAAREALGPGVDFYVWRCERPDPGAPMPSGDHVCEWAAERAADKYGLIDEDGDGLYAPGEEAERELTDLLEAWARKHIELPWVAVGEPEYVTALVRVP